MADEKIGSVKLAKSGAKANVTWDPQTKEVKVHIGYFPEHAGKANSAGEAMRKAEAHCYNK